jgi:MFS family permease
MIPRMKSSRRTLWMLCLTSAGWAFSFGLGAPLASLWLRDAGYSARLIGLNTSLYYLGVALAALAVPWLMRKAGRACVVTGIVGDAVVTALFPWGDSLPFWFALRLIGGMATALSLIPMETLVNHNAPPERRARDFGFYAFSVALGVGLGSLIGLPLYPLVPHWAFALGGAVTLAAAVVAWFGWPKEGTLVEEISGDDPLSLRGNSLSYGSAWVQGFLEGGLVTFLSIYLFSLGYAEGAVSLLVGGLFAGVILCQVPVAWLADRVGRLHILLGCHALLLASLLAVWLAPATVTLSMCLFVLGTCCGAMYPLGLALLGDRVSPTGMARANACYLASNCAGSLSGPLLFGLVIDLYGQPSQFLAGMMSVVVVIGLWLASGAALAPRAVASRGTDATPLASGKETRPSRRIAG